MKLQAQKTAKKKKKEKKREKKQNQTKEMQTLIKLNYVTQKYFKQK